MVPAETLTLPAAEIVGILPASGIAKRRRQGRTPDGDDKVVERGDPILSPGKISQHVHQIFGSSAFAPKVTYESLQQAGCTTVGDAAGNGNAADKSIYWHPALFMEAKDGSGYIRVKTLGHKLYYKTAGTGTKRVPFEFPHGFRMLAGNPFMRAAAKNEQQQNITQWICHDSAVCHPPCIPLGMRKFADLVALRATTKEQLAASQPV